MISFILNGKNIEYNGNPSLSLLKYLRNELDISSVKDGCSAQSACGACMVEINGEAKLSCVTKIEKLEGKVGEPIKFTDILFLGDEKEVKIGNPTIKDAVVEGKILKQGKAKKVTGIKHKAKKRYKVKFGHRQQMTEVEILKI